MAEFQLKKFSNLFARISDNIDSRENKGSHTEIYEEIKNQLREEFNTVYEEWKNSNFDPNFRFKLCNIFNTIKETTLLNVVIGCRKEAACIPLVQCLLDKGANLNTRDSDNHTPLSRAVLTKWDKNKEVVALLLKKGADPNLVVEDTFGETSLHIACTTPDNESFNLGIIELLLKNGANVNKGDNFKNTVLHKIAGQSCEISNEVPTLKKQIPELIKLLMKYGANIYARDNRLNTPADSIVNYGCGIRDKKFANSIVEFLGRQKYSTEYHKKLLELVEQNKDLKSLASIIKENGLMCIRGIQLCSQVIPKTLKIPGMKIVVEGNIVEGEIKQEFSQGEENFVVYVNGNGVLQYYDLFRAVISVLRKDPTLFSGLESELRVKVWDYVFWSKKNVDTIRKELWGEYEVDSTPETEKKEDNVTKQDVARKESSKDDQGTTIPKFHGKKKTGDVTDNKKRINETVNSNGGKKAVVGHHPTNSSVHSHTETKNPPIFSKKQKIAIAIGVVTALATALVCYLVQLPVWAIIVSALVDGVGAYIVSSKLYDVSICNGAGQQPGL